MSSHVCSEHSDQRDKKYCVYCVLEYYKDVNHKLKQKLLSERRTRIGIQERAWIRRQYDKNF